MRQQRVSEARYLLCKCWNIKIQKKNKMKIEIKKTCHNICQNRVWQLMRIMNVLYKQRRPAAIADSADVFFFFFISNVREWNKNRALSMKRHNKEPRIYIELYCRFFSFFCLYLFAAVAIYFFYFLCVCVVC